MKITVFSAGSRGDIQPCLALSKGLQQAGFQVRVAAPENFEQFIQENGVDFFPLSGDVEQIMASDTGRSFMEAGSGNPLRSIFTIRKLIRPVVMSMAEDAYEATRDAQGLICLGVFSAFGQAIAEALDVPILHTEPTPLIPTRAFPAPSWPVQKNIGKLHNYISGLLMFYVLWLWYRPFVKAFRKHLGLPKMTAARFYRTFRATPMLSAYSPQIIPHPSDWPASVHITGYYFLDSQQEWEPTPELEEFLKAGEPPVYIGFGSMSGMEPEQLAELIQTSLQKCGRRGLIMKGWGGIRPEMLSEEIFVMDAAPHSWLFPRMAALVHHGGAGTTAEGLRAGIPTVVVPFILDQTFWGRRIEALGLGPAPIDKRNLTSDRLAEAITTAVTDPEMRQLAKEFGEAVRAENGIDDAVEIIRGYFGNPLQEEGNRS